MRVLFINTVYGRGSTGRIVADLGKMLEENGHEFKVAYGRGDNSADPHCYRIGNDFDMYIHAGLSRITDRAGFYSKMATKKLVEFIKEYNPDIIHLHNLHGYYVNLRVLFEFLADEYKGRIIWTLHDCWGFTGHCVYFSYAGCDKWKGNCGNCCQKGGYPCSKICDQSERNIKEKKALYERLKDRLEIVTVSHWLEGQVRDSILSIANVKTIYNGVDTAKFRFRSNSIKEKLGIVGKYMFLAVSDDWDTRKGYEKLFELSEAIDETSVIVVIGLSKKQIEELPHNIIGFEHTWNQEELIEYYSSADVLFNPSKEETFGLVTVEALACGTPCIVYNTTACTEIIDGKDKCGVVIEMTSSLEDIISELYLKKELISEKCRQRAENDFSLKTMTRNYMDLYLYC